MPVNQLFGVQTGMGMGLLTFDWSQISWIGSPLMGEFPFSPFFLSPSSGGILGFELAIWC